MNDYLGRLGYLGAFIMPDQKHKNDQQFPGKAQGDPHLPAELAGDKVGNERCSKRPPTALPKPMAQDVYDRLNVHLQRTTLEGANGLVEKQLEQIGRLIQVWRIKQGYTRLDLAEKLDLDADRLLYIEHGIGLPADIMEAHLLSLLSFLTSEALDKELKAGIQRYLDSLKSSS
jgi:hypothetical protein